MNIGYDTRDVYAMIATKVPYTNWMKRKIKKYKLKEGVDYNIETTPASKLGGRPQHFYKCDHKTLRLIGSTVYFNNGIASIIENRKKINELLKKGEIIQHTKDHMKYVDKFLKGEVEVNNEELQDESLHIRASIHNDQEAIDELNKRTLDDYQAKVAKYGKDRVFPAEAIKHLVGG